MPGTPHPAPPFGHCSAGVQLELGTPLSTHTSQSSQALEQPGTSVHGGHLAGSVTVLEEHSGDPIHTGVGASGKTQHPKQSQPLGVSGRHVSRHSAGWDASASAHVVLPPSFTFESCAHALPSGGKFGACSSGSQR